MLAKGYTAKVLTEFEQPGTQPGWAIDNKIGTVNGVFLFEIP